MDALLYAPAEAGRRPAATNFIGILYAEDFDDPAPFASSMPPIEEPADVRPALTQDDVDAAVAVAVAVARREWDESAVRERTTLVTTLKASLADASRQAETITQAIAEGTVKTILATLAGVLPKACNEHGPKEVRALLERLLPMLRAEPKITIRVNADLVAALRQDIVDIQSDFAGIITVAPAPIERGDLKITWENGSLVRDTRQILQAMQEALGQLGLLDPLETSPKRIMAYAE